MNIATDTHGIIYLIDVPASVGVRSCGQSSMSLRNAHTQTRNVQTQTQSTLWPLNYSRSKFKSACMRSFEVMNIFVRSRKKY